MLYIRENEFDEPLFVQLIYVERLFVEQLFRKHQFEDLLFIEDLLRKDPVPSTKSFSNRASTTLPTINTHRHTLTHTVTDMHTDAPKNRHTQRHILLLVNTAQLLISTLRPELHKTCSVPDERPTKSSNVGFNNR